MPFTIVFKHVFLGFVIRDFLVLSLVKRRWMVFTSHESQRLLFLLHQSSVFNYHICIYIFCMKLLLLIPRVSWPLVFHISIHWNHLIGKLIVQWLTIILIYLVCKYAVLMVLSCVVLLLMSMHRVLTMIKHTSFRVLLMLGFNELWLKSTVFLHSFVLVLWWMTMQVFMTIVMMRDVEPALLLTISYFYASFSYIILAVSRQRRLGGLSMVWVLVWIIWWQRQPPFQVLLKLLP